MAIGPPNPRSAFMGWGWGYFSEVLNLNFVSLPQPTPTIAVGVYYSHLFHKELSNSRAIFYHYHDYIHKAVLLFVCVKYVLSL